MPGRGATYGERERPERWDRSSETIYGILRKSLADILAQVRKLEPLVRDLPLTNPDLILRIADREKIGACEP